MITKYLYNPNFGGLAVVVNMDGARSPKAMACMQIDCDFPGGNIVVEDIKENTAYLRQDLRDTEGNWFYWAFRVRDLRAHAGQTLKFQFTASKVIGTRGPCVSLDGGQSWTWLGPVNNEKNRYQYDVPPGVEELRFSMNWPYLHADLEQFLTEFEYHPHLRRDILCRDRSGRPVHRLRLGCIDRPPQYRMLLTARHHCCESTPNFVLEGFIGRMLRNRSDNLAADWYLQNVEVWVIPFVDTDGVEAGDQGKNRRPYDHNRAYAATPCPYPSVQALRDQVPAWLDGRPWVDLDLHCPAIRGQYNEHIYFVGSKDPENWDRIQQFSDHLELHNHSGLPFSKTGNLPFGESWNTNNDPALMSHARWARTLPNCRLSTTLEIPYANCGEVTVTPELARNFGRALMHAGRQFLT